MLFFLVFFFATFSETGCFSGTFSVDFSSFPSLKHFFQDGPIQRYSCDHSSSSQSLLVFFFFAVFSGDLSNTVTFSALLSIGFPVLPFLCGCSSVGDFSFEPFVLIHLIHIIYFICTIIINSSLMSKHFELMLFASSELIPLLSLFLSASCSVCV